MATNARIVGWFAYLDIVHKLLREEIEMESKMKFFTDLNLGFSDAENYKRRENKEFFNRVFVKSHYLDNLCNSNIFFLIGEKGTGKTAYAVYMTNNTHRNTSSILTYIRETEYQQFVYLKSKNHLLLSDYTLIWKVIIYLLLSEKIATDPQEQSIFQYPRFKNLKMAIDEYYSHAFSPEIIQAINFLERTDVSAGLISKYATLNGNSGYEMSFSENRFQTNLIYILKQFESALSSIKLRHDHILFVDGIDIRPSSIQYDDYLLCVKGLANAVWSVNSDFFSNIKDSKGRLRVVLLIRPDIFNSLNLQNQNNKVRDNAILLDWRTTYADFYKSMLFEMADKLLASQQSFDLDYGQAWDYYFPYKVISRAYDRDADDIFDHSFIPFLRYSLYRPRDIVTMLRILQENSRMYNESVGTLSEKDFKNPNFSRKYSTYLLGEIKDHLSFYYSDADYELFLKFFQFLKGRTRFNYSEYITAYDEMMEFLSMNNKTIPQFLASSGEFLQFLYDLNVISYVEDPDDPYYRKAFISWCFRERTPSNLSPKVKTHVRYEIHYGLAKALRMGKRVK